MGKFIHVLVLVPTCIHWNATQHSPLCDFETGSIIPAVAAAAAATTVVECKWVSVCHPRANNSTTITAISHFTHCSILLRLFMKCTNCFTARNANRKTDRPTNDAMRERETSIRGIQFFSLFLCFPWVNQFSAFVHFFSGGRVRQVLLFYVNKMLCPFSFISLHSHNWIVRVIIFNNTKRRASIKFALLLFACFVSILIRVLASATDIYVITCKSDWQDENVRHIA